MLPGSHRQRRWCQGTVKVQSLRLQRMDPRPRFREGRHFAGVTPPIQCLVMPAAAGIHLC